MPQIALIRVLSTNDPRLLNVHGQVVSEAFGLDVISHAVPDQPEGVHNEESFHSAKSKICALVQSMAHDVDGILISCSSDPGLEEARALVDIPVVGAGSAGAGAALALGPRRRCDTPSLHRTHQHGRGRGASSQVPGAGNRRRPCRSCRVGR